MNALQILLVLIIIKRVFFFFLWVGGELKMGLKPQALFGGDEVHLG